MMMVMILMLAGGGGAVSKPPIVLDVRESAPVKRQAPAAAEGASVAGLPYARGKRFGTLDAYLSHLESNAALDLPWWRQVRPGLYEHVKHMRGAAPEMATRAQLLKRFGFTR